MGAATPAHLAQAPVGQGHRGTKDVLSSPVASAMPPGPPRGAGRGRVWGGRAARRVRGAGRAPGVRLVVSGARILSDIGVSKWG